MNRSEITQAYLADLDISTDKLDIDFLQQLQSQHISRYSFNSLAVVLGQEMPLDLPFLFDKIVTKKRGGYCFEHNKLVFNILEELGCEVRLLLARVVYNRDVDNPRTHRISLINLNGQQYIVDAGFGALGARYPVKFTEGDTQGEDQDQGDGHYRIILSPKGEYHYQVFKDGEFFTLYVFDLNTYTESDCMLGHFYSHQHPEAAFVNNLVVCRKHFNDVHSLRNGEFHCIQDGQAVVTELTTVEALHQKLTDVFALDVDIAVSAFLFNKFVIKS